MKMKFGTLFIFAFSFGVFNVNAQSGGQIRAGINVANISVTDDGRVNDAKALTSFQVGILGDVPLATNLFSLQTGIIFSGKGAKTESGNPSSTPYYKATTNPYYLEVPVNFIVKAPIGSDSKFFIGAGPYGAIGVGGKNKIEGKTLVGGFSSENSIKFSNDDPSTLNEEEGAGFGIIKRFDYGLNGTAGIEGRSIILAFNYGHGLAKLQSGGNSAEDNNNKHRVLSFSLGFKL